MSLTEHLARVLDQLDAARGVALVGMDGIVVEEKRRDPALDLQALGAECCGLFKTLAKIAQDTGLGAPEEFSLGAIEGQLVVRRITPEYFTLLVIAPNGLFGKGRYLLRREAAAIRQEL
jgi:predicted regulator of Ras-like GTPase activity (Roadblock/LC7/MglB family)